MYASPELSSQTQAGDGDRTSPLACLVFHGEVPGAARSQVRKSLLHLAMHEHRPFAHRVHNGLSSAHARSPEGRQQRRRGRKDPGRGYWGEGNEPQDGRQRVGFGHRCHRWHPGSCVTAERHGAEGPEHEGFVLEEGVRERLSASRLRAGPTCERLEGFFTLWCTFGRGGLHEQGFEHRGPVDRRVVRGEVVLVLILVLGLVIFLLILIFVLVLVFRAISGT
mmetsp:Transcript_44244/g.112664  ORF Transcript_44244/g.112664 Transcript_44244/m.112664 type:complete len:222 (-) Transcript_44244:377-1042(-)